MSLDDAGLRTFLAESDPPPEDAAFVIAVMEQVERVRFRLEMAALVIGGFAVGLVLWALAPVLQVAAQVAGPLTSPAAMAPIVAGVAMATFLWSWSSEGAVPAAA